MKRPDSSWSGNGAADFSSMKTRLPLRVFAVARTRYQAHGVPENGAGWTAWAVPLTWQGTPPGSPATPAQLVATARRRLRKRSRQTQPAASSTAARISRKTIAGERSDTVQ